MTQGNRPAPNEPGSDGRPAAPIPHRAAPARVATVLVCAAILSLLISGCENLFPGTSPFGKQRNGADTEGQGRPGNGKITIETDGLQFQYRLIKVAAEVTPSVVNVKVNAAGQTPPGHPSSGQSEGVGSGVIYRSDGYIVTNAHVVEGADQVLVALADGQDVSAAVVGVDTFSDIAVLKIPRKKLPVATLGSARRLKVGQIALAIGSPLGFQHSVSMGIVSALDRSVPEGGPALSNVIQTDAPISPGNSGGALVDLHGRLIGINTAFIPPAANAVSIGFAIPVDTAKRVADQLIKSGKAAHPFMGIDQVGLNRQTAAQFGVGRASGVLIVSVMPGSPAAKAGLHRGEVIVGLDGEKIETTEDLFAALEAHDPGDTIELTVAKGDQERKVKVTLTRRNEKQN